MPWTNHAMNAAVEDLERLKREQRCGCPDAVAFGEALDDLSAAVDTWTPAPPRLSSDANELRAVLAAVDGAWHEFQRLYQGEDD